MAPDLTLAGRSPEPLERGVPLRVEAVGALFAEWTKRAADLWGDLAAKPNGC